MQRIAFLACSLTGALVGGGQHYWLDANGKPKKAPEAGAAATDKAHNAALRASAQPKSFELQPQVCMALDDDAKSAFAARYSFGWTSGQKVNAGDAIRNFDPTYYYTRPADRTSGSGYGSDLGTKLMETDRAFIAEAIRERNITTMVDAPCGDVNWQFGAWELDSLRAYVGLDLVAQVINLDAARFAHHSNKRFAAWDIVRCPIPQIKWPDSNGASPPDLVHSRHALQHMPPRRARTAAINLVASGARYLMVTTYGYNVSRPQHRSANIQEGGMALHDMATFGYPPPLRCTKDTGHCLYEFDEQTRARYLQQHDQNQPQSDLSAKVH